MKQLPGKGMQSGDRVGCRMAACSGTVIRIEPCMLSLETAEMSTEYILYYRGKIVGGIYDDRFLVKPVKSAVAMMPDADTELPYEGAKEMLLVDNVDNRAFLSELLEAMYDDLPSPGRKK